MANKWHDNFFNKLQESPYNREDYKQFGELFGFLFDELGNVLNGLENSSNEADRERYNKYETILSDWYGYVNRINSKKDSHFGYQMNLTKRSFLVDFFRIMESFEVIQNNFGDIQDISDIEVIDEQNPKTFGNNYAMDIKGLEWDVVRLIANNLGLPPQPRLVELLQNPEKYKDGYWGYVTSGGSESNLWGIIQGFAKYPNGIVYFSEGAHYSIPKGAQSRNYKIIPQISDDNDAIDVVALMGEIENNWNNNNIPAIVILTSGTTKYGAVDDVASVKKQLVELQIPHYLHIDAAFYGGIPQNQINAPTLGNIEEWGYDSVAVSMHKYIGYPAAKGVLVSTKKPIVKFIDYIGQEDNTVLGSRDVPPFSLRQQVMEILQYSKPNEYTDSVRNFASMLISANLEYKLWTDGEREGCVFVFVVDKTSPEYRSVCKKWQLSEFVGKDGLHRLHAVVFPYHAEDKLKMLVEDLVKIVVK